MSILTTQMAEKILEERGDGCLVIPEYITKLPEDFTIVLNTHINCDDFSNSLNFFYKIIVENNNQNYCSLDGVLFTKDMKKLVCYPYGKRNKKYIVPEGVEVIESYAFTNNCFINHIIFPSSLKTIKLRALCCCNSIFLAKDINEISLVRECNSSIQVDIPEGLEIVEEDAFAFCLINRLTLPKSLESLHWSNLLGVASSMINTLEIPLYTLEIPSFTPDIINKPKDEEYEQLQLSPSYTPPLLISNVMGNDFLSMLYSKNSFSSYYTDENGIIWSNDSKTLINFPVLWSEPVYYLPEHVTYIFLWAFNYSFSIEEIISSHEVEFVGKTAGNDYSRLTYEENFFIVKKDFKPNISVKETTTMESNSKEKYAFISYSTKDQQKADAVRLLLKENGISSWMAPYDIPAGSKYAHVINDALKNCACLVLLLSNASQNSQFVVREVERAVSYNKSIVTIQLEDVKLNSIFEFYIGIEQIVAVQNIDSKSPEMKKIIKGIQNFVND